MDKAMKQEVAVLIHQFLRENGLTETKHRLEEESGVYFDWNYAEMLCLDGKFDILKRYLRGFVKPENCLLLFGYIDLQNYLEAIDRNDLTSAAIILPHLGTPDNPMVRRLQELMREENRANAPEFASWTPDMVANRARVLQKIRRYILEGTFIPSRMTIPELENNRLMMLLRQSLYWQHDRCINPIPNPSYTLLVDHVCGQALPPPPRLNFRPRPIGRPEDYAMDIPALVEPPPAYGPPAPRPYTLPEPPARILHPFVQPPAYMYQRQIPHAFVQPPAYAHTAPNPHAFVQPPAYAHTAPNPNAFLQPYMYMHFAPNPYPQRAPEWEAGSSSHAVLRPKAIARGFPLEPYQSVAYERPVRPDPNTTAGGTSQPVTSGGPNATAGGTSQPVTSGGPNATACGTSQPVTSGGPNATGN